MSLRTRTMSIAGALAITAVAAVAQAAPQAEDEELPACPPGQEMAPAPAPRATRPATPPPAYEQGYEQQPAPPSPAAYQPRRRNRIFAPGAVSFMTGAGPANYFGRAVNDGKAFDVGAAWDARFVFGTSSVIALEAGYLGSTNTIDVAGENGYINSNGIDGTLRLQLPFRFQPYIFGGVGWNHMSINNADNPQVTRVFRTSDDQVVIPAGAGFTGYVTRHATVDLRGTYRLMPNQDIVINSDRAIHQWMAQARLGYTF